MSWDPEFLKSLNPEGSWKCSVCLVVNSSDKTVCVSCEAKREDSGQHQGGNENQPINADTLSHATVSTAGTGLHTLAPTTTPRLFTFPIETGTSLPTFTTGAGLPTLAPPTGTGFNTLPASTVGFNTLPASTVGFNTLPVAPWGLFKLPASTVEFNTLPTFTTTAHVPTSVPASTPVLDIHTPSSPQSDGPTEVEMAKIVHNHLDDVLGVMDTDERNYSKGKVMLTGMGDVGVLGRGDPYAEDINYDDGIDGATETKSDDDAVAVKGEVNDDDNDDEIDGNSAIPRSTLPPMKDANRLVCNGLTVGAVNKNGSELLSWGCNDDGALGRLTSDDVPESVPGIVGFPEGVKTFVELAVGDSHCAAIADVGGVYGWGTYRNAAGRFGFGIDNFRDGDDDGVQNLPIKIVFPKTATKPKQLVCGADHTMLLTVSKQLYTWGTNCYRGLARQPRRGGLRTREEVTELDDLVPAQALLPRGEKPVMIGSGDFHSFAKTNRGNMYAWGTNDDGRCGVEPAVADEGEENPSQQLDPTLVTSLSGLDDIAMITGGNRHSIVLTYTGKVYTFGSGEDGRLGIPAISGSGKQSKFADHHEPQQLTSLPPCKYVAAGESLSFAITWDNKIYSWGTGPEGTLAQGYGDDGIAVEQVFEPQEVPVEVYKAFGGTVISITAGSQCSAFLVRVGRKGTAKRRMKRKSLGRSYRDTPYPGKSRPRTGSRTPSKRKRSDIESPGSAHSSKGESKKSKL